MEDPVTKSYIVYCHTSPDGKRYIGITSQKPGKRFGINGSRYHRNPHLYAAITKYGWDSFSHDILCSGLTLEEAAKKEAELIELYNTTDRLYGYNHSLGGEGSPGVKMPDHVKELLRKINTGSHISEEHKDAIRKANSGKVLSEETKEKIRRANLGKTLPQEVRKKIGEKSRGNTYGAVRVLCVETGVVFPSVLEAAKRSGAVPGNISRCFRSGGTAKGYHWKRVGEEEAQDGHSCR